MDTEFRESQQVQQPSNPERRQFLIWIGSAWALFLGALSFPIYRYLKPVRIFDPFQNRGKAKVIGITLSDVEKPGMGANGGYANRGVILFRNSQNELRALDAMCTHAGCIASFKGEKIVCHCHGGTYDLNGNVIAGPPPRPLTSLRVIVENDELYVAEIQ